MRNKRVLVSLLVAGITGCSTSSVVVTGAPVTGAWGGAHASLSLTGAGGVITYDCAHGGLSAPILPDGTGSFDVPGVHVRDRGGPVRMGDIPDSLPARYLGQVSGARMTLRVLAGADTLGPFALQLEAAPQLFRCL